MSTLQQHYRTVEEIRQARLIDLLDQSESLSAFAKKIGKSPAQVSQWKNKSRRTEGGHAHMESASARHIEQKLGKPRDWMDHEETFSHETFSPMALDIATWFDELPRDKKHEAFAQIYMLIGRRRPTPPSTEATMGYCLDDSAWGRGFATEAAAALLQWAFDTLDLNRVQAETDTRNGASSRVLEKLGFVLEGTLRQDCIVEGEVSDTWVYGLLRRDWKPPNGAPRVL